MWLCYSNCTRTRYPYLFNEPVLFRYVKGYALDSEFSMMFNDVFVHQAMMHTCAFDIILGNLLQSRLLTISNALDSML